MSLGRASRNLRAHGLAEGASTRLIGALIMCHSDDNGLVLPPRIAQRKVVIVPIWRNDDERALVMAKAAELRAALRPVAGLVHIDDRDNMRPGWKYGEWERKGMPIRIELGPRDVAAPGHKIINAGGV